MLYEDLIKSRTGTKLEGLGHRELSPRPQLCVVPLWHQGCPRRAPRGAQQRIQAPPIPRPPTLLLSRRLRGGHVEPTACSATSQPHGHAEHGGFKPNNGSAAARRDPKGAVPSARRSSKFIAITSNPQPSPASVSSVNFSGALFLFPPHPSLVPSSSARSLPAPLRAAGCSPIFPSQRSAAAPGPCCHPAAAAGTGVAVRARRCGRAHVHAAGGGRERARVCICVCARTRTARAREPARERGRGSCGWVCKRCTWLCTRTQGARARGHPGRPQGPWRISAKPALCTLVLAPTGRAFGPIKRVSALN